MNNNLIVKLKSNLHVLTKVEKRIANSVAIIGWGNLMLVWCGLMIAGVLTVFPYKKRKKELKNENIN